MRNEDLTNFKTIAILNEKYREDRSSFSKNFPMKEILENCVNTISKLNNEITIENHINNNQNSKNIFYTITSLISKLYLVFGTLICILFIYYVYIYVSIRK